jgi:hypothetical protein
VVQKRQLNINSKAFYTLILFYVILLIHVLKLYLFLELYNVYILYFLHLQKKWKILLDYVSSLTLKPLSQNTLKKLD